MAEALIVAESADAPEVGRLARLLDHFGVAWRSADSRDCLDDSSAAKAKGELRLLGGSIAFTRLAEWLAVDESSRSAWQRQVHSAFVFGSDATSLTALLAAIGAGSDGAVVSAPDASTWRVTERDPDFCRSMTGVSGIPVRPGELCVATRRLCPTVFSIIESGDCASFVRLELYSVPVFLCTADPIDIASPLSGDVFDVRAHFLTAVPAALYIRWSFAGLAWELPKDCACLVIDDPLLRPTYGNLNFEKLRQVMADVGFTASIAFIPINWSRNARETVDLFRRNSELLSVSIHGCDHTSGEFVSRDDQALLRKVHRALLRMDSFSEATGLPYDPVMVFPQGLFSSEAMRALRKTRMLGVVNTDVKVSVSQSTQVDIADYWKLAITTHEGFPIFSRRYPTDGIANFAFDVLVGKPCILTAHHGDFANDCREIARFIARLNSLYWDVKWCSLGEMLRSGYRQRWSGSDTFDVQMYSREVSVVNARGKPTLFHIYLPPSVSALDTRLEILVGGRGAGSHPEGTPPSISLELAPNECASIRAMYTGVDVRTGDFGEEPLGKRIRALLRRRLSEIRDELSARVARRSQRVAMIRLDGSKH